MKKLILTLLLIAGSISFTNAQSWDEGSSVVSGGIGLGSNLYSGSQSLRIPPLFATYDYGIRDMWSVGGIVGVAGSKDEWRSGPYQYQYNYTHILIGARGAYHFYSDYTWDVYGGASLGFDIVSGSYSGNRPTQYDYDVQGSSLNLGLFVGGRYYFDDQIAAFAELGYNIGFLSIGVSFKLQ